MEFIAFVPTIPVDQLLDVARAADESGWGGLAVPDCVFHPETVTARYPYSVDGLRPWEPNTPYVDPYTAIPAMAAITKQLRFFSDVLKAPLRQPLLLAKSLGTAEALFPGRIALGVGTSWMPEEFSWLKEDMASRGSRLDEMIEIIRRCLSPGWAEYHGRHYDFDRLIMSPVPDRPIPIYVGGHAKPALRRAARLGDGWLAAYIDEAELKAVIPNLLAEHADSDRADRPFEIMCSTMTLPSVADVQRLEALGVTSLAIRPYDAGASSGQSKCDAIKRYSEDVVARCGGSRRKKL